MLKYVVAVLLSLIALSAYAATTWSTPAASSKYVASQATVTTGTEVCPTRATDGFDIESVSTYDVSLEMTTLDGGVFVNADAFVTTGFYPGKVRVCHYSPVTGTWSRVPALDLDVTVNETTHTWKGIPVTLKVGRLAYLPHELGPGGRVTITALRGQ